MVTAASVTLGSALLAPPSQAATTPTMVVIGDSITWRGDNIPGSTNRGWWSYLGRELGLRIIRHAERGSGFGKRGKAADGTSVCGGSTFYSRLDRPAVAADVTAARLVIVAGGVNDMYRCVYRNGAWSQVPTSEGQLKRDVHRTMLRLAELRPTRRSSVYITAPYGPFAAGAAAKTWIVPLIKAEALAAGFRYVDTSRGTLDGDRTDDGVHPNYAGNLRLFHDLYVYGVMARWGAGVTDYARLDVVPPPASTGVPYDPDGR